jgi:hypothetical protein
VQEATPKATPTDATQIDAKRAEDVMVVSSG